MQKYSEAKTRAIKIGNLIGVSSVINCILFGIVFLYLGDMVLVRACMIAGLIYLFTISFNFIGFPNIGRPLNLIAGDVVVFWFACHFRGESLLQLFYFSLCVMPFMYFAWEERSKYWIALVSVAFLILGEVNAYQFFEPSQNHYDMKVVRIFSLLAPLMQIVAGFFYFLKLSVRFENESNENLKKLEREYEKQIHVHKMSSLGEMAAGISHEINNPLTVIISGVEILKRLLMNKFEEKDPVFVNIARIETTALRIAKIVRSLKKFSRNAEHDPSEKISVQKVINETLDLCRERFIKNQVDMQVEIEKGLELFCRPTEISQVLINLLNNAFDAMVEQNTKWVKITALQFGKDMVEILVVDSGVGISKENIDKIMDPFFTTKAVDKGTGLGLSLSKGIVESHHGTLSYIRGAKNTTFQILLPSGI